MYFHFVSFHDDNWTVYMFCLGLFLYGWSDIKIQELTVDSCAYDRVHCCALHAPASLNVIEFVISSEHQRSR